MSSSSSSSYMKRIYTKGRNMNKGFKSVPASRHASDDPVTMRYRSARDFWNDEEHAAHIGYDNSEDDRFYTGSTNEGHHAASDVFTSSH